jgi:hypothetical protein
MSLFVNTKQIIDFLRYESLILGFYHYHTRVVYSLFTYAGVPRSYPAIYPLAQVPPHCCSAFQKCVCLSAELSSLGHRAYAE